jgi:[calcium/calmodulin-dependent protein kinase] kinase
MNDHIDKAPGSARLRVESPPALDSASSTSDKSNRSKLSQPLYASDDQLERPKLEHKASTFPIEVRGKGQAHDPLEDRIYLRIGTGSGLEEGISDEEQPIVCESPSGVDDDIYEQAYQEEMNRILESQKTASLVLTRRVEHIEKLRKHPNVLASSVNHAIDFAGSTASRVHARARTSRIASFARETRERARANVNEHMDARAAAKANYEEPPKSAPILVLNDEDTPPSPLAASPGLSTPPSRSRTPNSERRLRDAARIQAGQVLKGAARRLNEKASRLETRGGATSPYPET